jgi:cardiolipin synthase
MDLIVQPADGAVPLIAAIKKAKSQVEIVIFRFGLKELQKALVAAVGRGVKVHALIAHTNTGGGKFLRKLERDFLEAGVTVSRTDDDLVRYHGKFMIVDRAELYVLAFNFTKLDTDRSRSLGIVTRNTRLIAEAVKLFEADAARQPYTAGHDAFVVSPENARVCLAQLIKDAKKELLIYDLKIVDRQMLNLLNERAKAGVDIRVLGKVGKKAKDVRCEKMPKLRLHVRAILRDGQDLFVGSQSLRTLELDKRREVGIIVRDSDITKRFREVFDEDWSETDSGRKDEKREEKEKKAEEKKAS